MCFVLNDISAPPNPLLLQPDTSAAPKEDLQQSPGHHDGAEKAGHNADAQGHGETSNGSAAEVVEHRSGDEGGDVRIHNGRDGLAESRVDGSKRCFSRSLLLLDALIDEDVAIHGHTDGEHDSRDAGKRQGRLQADECREDEKNRHTQGHIRSDSRNL